MLQRFEFEDGYPTLAELRGEGTKPVVQTEVELMHSLGLWGAFLARPANSSTG